MDRNNIIVFFSDQQRWDTVGAYGQPLDVTPNLDKMAANGVKFEHAFTCQPVCGPARACLQTGKYATETGCYRNGIKLQTDEITIAKILNDSGYQTGYIGKWHLASNQGESDQVTKGVSKENRGGYQFWHASDVLEFTSHGYGGYMFDGDRNRIDFDGYRVDSQTDVVIDYLDNVSKESPFFLFVSYLEPHHQNDHNRFEGPDGSKEKFANYVTPPDLEGTDGDWRENYPDYLGACNSLDANLGRVRQKLDNLGISDNTMIIYTSDHGCHFKTRNSEYKRSCHDSSIRIPMIAYGAGFEGGLTTDHMVSLIDIPPTILRAANVDIPEHMQGRPLQDLLNSDIDDWQDEVFLQISESQVGRCIRTPRYKYSVRADELKGWDYADSDVYTEDFLYDLENDPHEKNNLVSSPEYENVRIYLRERLKERMKQANEKVPQILPRM